jgi:hypothetical protein
LASEASSPSAPHDRDDDDYFTEKTEVIYGAENMFKRAMQGIPLARKL